MNTINRLFSLSIGMLGILSEKCYYEKYQILCWILAGIAIILAWNTTKITNWINKKDII